MFARLRDVPPAADGLEVGRGLPMDFGASVPRFLGSVELHLVAGDQTSELHGYLLAAIQLGTDRASNDVRYPQ